MAIGTAALAVLVTAAVVAALLYVSPPGQKTVAFYTDDAASVRAGDEVRVAGIAVGKVKDLSLEANRVRVEARVDDGVFVGNRSAIEVRMLTVVGGYYVDLVPLGATPLGNDVIPLQRVTMPYNLVRTLNDSSNIIHKLDPKPLNQSLSEIQAGLSGENVRTLSSVIDAGNSIMSTVDRQRGQITAILNLSDEYIAKLSDIRGELRQLVEKIATLQTMLEIFGKGFGESSRVLGTAIANISTVGVFYDHHRDEFLEKVREFLDRGRLWINHNGVIVRGLRDLQGHFERLLDVQQARPELLATDLCIPMPGSPC
jgi:phospholipid/cholesterol/gamma-HCH transport system substrate-binding protein